MAKAWPALDIHVPGCDPQLQDLVLAELDDFQPSAIHELDDSSLLRAFFASSNSRDAAARALASAFGSHLFVEALDVHDEDWAARSQAALRSVTIGRIVVAPPWDLMGSDPRTTNVMGSDPVTVVIRPSMGFGTGHHATTRLVLRALQAVQVQDRTTLDIGCGSGVLALAAARLGARTALGIDIDPDALASAVDNLELNGIGERVRFEERDFRESSACSDLVLANLSGGLLARSATTLAELVKRGGSLIISGFMESETAVVPAFETLLSLQNVDQEDEWLCAVFQKAP